MTKEEIIESLGQNHEEFIQLISKFDEADFEFHREGKWSAGQHLKHIILSVQPLRQGLIMPVIVLQMVFGKSQRASKSYNEIIADYKKVLAQGAKASEEFVPEKISFSEKDALLNELKMSMKKLLKLLNKLNEKDLDSLLVPHPLMGKITLRELLYFIIYHVGLHQEILLRDLKLSKLNH